MRTEDRIMALLRGAKLFPGTYIKRGLVVDRNGVEHGGRTYKHVRPIPLGEEVISDLGTAREALAWARIEVEIAEQEREYRRM